MTRLAHVKRFYQLLDEVALQLGGTRRLADCSGKSGWPLKGVYFFFEEGENRSTSGNGARVVRVGTHATNNKSRATLWHRLHAHRGYLRGALVGGGNCRGSIFRRHLGAAFIQRDSLNVHTWDRGQSAPRDVREAEHEIERLVSRYIGAMPFLWLEVSAGNDGGQLMRCRIEANSIGLLSNQQSQHTGGPIDPSSPSWIGGNSPRAAIRDSGLWNVDHVAEEYDESFLEDLQALVKAMKR